MSEPMIWGRNAKLVEYSLKAQIALKWFNADITRISCLT